MNEPDFEKETIFQTIADTSYYAIPELTRNTPTILSQVRELIEHEEISADILLAYEEDTGNEPKFRFAKRFLKVADIAWKKESKKRLEAGEKLEDLVPFLEKLAEINETVAGAINEDDRGYASRAHRHFYTHASDYLFHLAQHASKTFNDQEIFSLFSLDSDDSEAYFAISNYAIELLNRALQMSQEKKDYTEMYVIHTSIAEIYIHRSIVTAVTIQPVLEILKKDIYSYATLKMLTQTLDLTQEYQTLFENFFINGFVLEDQKELLQSFFENYPLVPQQERSIMTRKKLPLVKIHELITQLNVLQSFNLENTHEAISHATKALIIWNEYNDQIRYEFTKGRENDPYFMRRLAEKHVFLSKEILAKIVSVGNYISNSLDEIAQIDFDSEWLQNTVSMTKKREHAKNLLLTGSILSQARAIALVIVQLYQASNNKDDESTNNLLTNYHEQIREDLDTRTQLFAENIEDSASVESSGIWWNYLDRIKKLKASQYQAQNPFNQAINLVKNSPQIYEAVENLKKLQQAVLEATGIEIDFNEQIQFLTDFNPNSLQDKRPEPINYTKKRTRRRGSRRKEENDEQ